MDKMKLSVRDCKDRPEEKDKPNIELWLEQNEDKVALFCTTPTGSSWQLMTFYPDATFSRWRFLGDPFADKIEER